MIGFAFLIGCGAGLLGIIGGMVLHKILVWYLEGAVSGLQCVLIAGLYVGLIICIITAPSTPARLLFIITLFVFLALLPIGSKLSDRHDQHLYLSEKAKQYHAAIESDPINRAARSKLARVLEEQGRLDEAIQEISEVVQLAPNDIEEAYYLKYLLRTKEEEKIPLITCPSCGHSNPPGRTHCYNCEGYLSLGSELKQWLASGGMKQIAISIAAVIAVTAFAGLVLNSLSIVGRIIFILMALLIVVTALLVRAYRSF
jgi:hypothetical protein